MIYPLTVSMTPAFYYLGDWLFRAQLRCLSEQTAKDFDVLVVDPHYSIRAPYMAELAVHYGLHIVHVPYRPNQNIAKRLDCAVFNAAYCYSESPRIVRYSCWRFVRPDWTEICLNSQTNVDFYFHNCQPTNPTGRDDNSGSNHDTKIWDTGSDVVHWDQIPKHARLPGAAWGKESDLDSPAAVFPPNCYGNYMVLRSEWLAINGNDEVFTNTAHYEDMDFCHRAGNAGMKCERRAHKLYRLHHWYGSHSGRANIPPDYAFKRNCDACETACQVIEPKRFDLKTRIQKGELHIFQDDQVWVCKTCHLSGPIYHENCGEHTGFIVKSGRIKSTIIPRFKIGRNLAILTADMDGKPLADKVAIYNDSWTNPKYYEG